MGCPFPRMTGTMITMEAWTVPRGPKEDGGTMHVKTPAWTDCMVTTGTDRGWTGRTGELFTTHWNPPSWKLESCNDEQALIRVKVHSEVRIILLKFELINMLVLLEFNK